MNLVVVAKASRMFATEPWLRFTRAPPTYLYDMLLVSTSDHQVRDLRDHMPVNISELTANTNKLESAEFPPISGLSGHLIYYERKKQSMSEFAAAFETLNLRPFELLLLVDRVIIDNPFFDYDAPLRKHVDLMQKARSLSMVVLLVAGRVEIRVHQDEAKATDPVKADAPASQDENDEASTVVRDRDRERAKHEHQRAEAALAELAQLRIRNAELEEKVASLLKTAEEEKDVLSE